MVCIFSRGPELSDSPSLAEIYRGCTVSKGSYIRRSGDRGDYGYDGDSDLEDCEEDLPAPVLVHVVTETEMVPLKPVEGM